MLLMLGSRQRAAPVSVGGLGSRVSGAHGSTRSKNNKQKLLMKSSVQTLSTLPCPLSSFMISSCDFSTFSRFTVRTSLTSGPVNLFQRAQTDMWCSVSLARRTGKAVYSRKTAHRSKKIIHCRRSHRGSPLTSQASSGCRASDARAFFSLAALSAWTAISARLRPWRFAESAIWRRSGEAKSSCCSKSPL